MSRDGASVTRMSIQNATLKLMTRAADEGIATADADTAAGRRLAEMCGFCTYMLSEMSSLIERRHAQQGQV